MIIDFHAHVYPEGTAARVIAAATKRFGIKASGSGTASGLRADMLRCGVSRSVLLPVARLPEDVPPLNDWIRSISGDELIPFGAAHPLMKGLEEELDRLRSFGFKGVKMVPIFQRIFPDDPRCCSLYEALIEREMILVSHAGREPIDRGEVFGTPERFARVVDSYPDLRLVLTHLGGLRMWEDVRRHLLPQGRNLRFDTSYASFYLNGEEMAGLIREIDVERVLFGSDYPWADPGEAVRVVNKLELSEGEKARILYGNAVALLDSIRQSE